MPELLIRGLEAADAEAMHELFACPGVIANTLQLPWRSLEERREFLLQRQPDVHRLVAVVDGRAVANIGLHLERNRRRDCGWLGMAVHDAYQHQGIGSALMAAILDLADNWLGLRRLELTVFVDNAAAVHLYEKFGFRIEGTARAYAWRGGALVDAHYMARLRGASAANS